MNFNKPALDSPPAHLDWPRDIILDFTKWANLLRAFRQTHLKGSLISLYPGGGCDWEGFFGTSVDFFWKYVDRICQKQIKRSNSWQHGKVLIIRPLQVWVMVRSFDRGATPPFHFKQSSHQNKWYKLIKKNKQMPLEYSNVVTNNNKLEEMQFWSKGLKVLLYLGVNV